MKRCPLFSIISNVAFTNSVSDVVISNVVLSTVVMPLPHEKVTFLSFKNLKFAEWDW